MAAKTKALRVIAVASFVPAFPLLLAHGIVSHSPVPATGLVPLAFSAGASLFILVRQNKPVHDASEEAAQGEADSETPPDGSSHSIVTFAVDLIAAAALLIVLVFSWLESARFNGQQATLAAYATIPLLVNLFLHLYLAVRSFSSGLALHDLTQYLAWQVLPADCPNCEHRLRPSSPPRIPWLDSARRAKLPAAPGPEAPAAAWKVPRWFKRRASDESAALLVNDDEHDRYRDEPEEGGPSSTYVEDPVEVVVSPGKKSKKVKDSPLPADYESEEVRW
ncbi:hypothetical protein TruAng_007996 [Truncatella angustata]|nr:hypothetical protein TruAng_007996 [Truncatella angustata]